jgi:hypothetical protein
MGGMMGEGRAFTPNKVRKNMFAKSTYVRKRNEGVQDANLKGHCFPELLFAWIMNKMIGCGKLRSGRDLWTRSYPAYPLVLVR